MKTVENTVNDDLAPVKDERVVRLNEIISTKLSAVSKGKREEIKKNKPAAKCILENWDSIDGLAYLTSDKFKEEYYELYCIAKSRLDQLEYYKAQKAKEESQKRINMQAFRNLNQERKTLTYSHNSRPNQFQIDNMIEYLKKGYRIYITSWCTGHTLAQMVVAGTLEDLKEAVGEDNLEVDGKDLVYNYPSCTVWLKPEEPKEKPAKESKKDTETTSETTLATPEPTNEKKSTT